LLRTAAADLLCDSARLDDWMREVPSGATPASFTAAQPPKRRASELQTRALPPAMHLPRRSNISTVVRSNTPGFDADLSSTGDVGVQALTPNTLRMLAFWTLPRYACCTSQ
jgi:hypothetical protein